MRLVALIDYGAGNVRSVERALEAGARRAQRGAEIALTNDPDVIARADGIVLPGQGAFDDCMAGLQARSGVTEALRENVLRRGAPFLGICVGMQLLAEYGLEHGRHEGLGWLGGACRELAPTVEASLPHMGWNEVTPVGLPHPVLAHLAPKQHVYFCHSYVLDPPSPLWLAACEHGERFCAAAGRENILGVQFHPEKSQTAGLDLMAAFLDWKPR